MISTSECTKENGVKRQAELTANFPTAQNSSPMKCVLNAKCAVFTAMKIQVMVFWVAKPCSVLW
jgi:hypothetical protein